MRNFYFILLLTLFFQSCTHKLAKERRSYDGLQLIDFCDLPKYAGQKVFIKAAYSGVDEYWALNSTTRCVQPLNVELDDISGKEIPKRFQKLFDSAHNSYWDTYLIVELTGVFENDSPNGYGHLGSNKARLIVKEYVSVTLAKRKK